MEKIAIELSIWINAPRERVWQAVSNPKQLEQWFIPPSLGAQMKQDDSGKIYICLGPMEILMATVEGIDPARQITQRSQPDGLLAATFRLVDEKGGTRLSVTVDGFEALAEDSRHDRLAPMQMGWERALENVRAFIDGTPLPFPEGYVAALFGYRRETQEKLAVERSIWINAPQQRVWQAITDLEQVEKWFSPGTKWQGTGLQVGGRFYVLNPETGAEMYAQVIEEVDSPRRFVTRSVPEPGEFATVTTWTLREERGGTRLTILLSGYELMPADGRHDPMEQNAFGFGMMLGNIKAHIEGQPLPNPGGF